MKIRNPLRIQLSILGILFSLTPSFTPKAEAAYFSLPTLDTTMTDPIFRTLAAGFMFRPVEPASDLGKIFGFYAGLGVGAVDQSATSTIISGAGTYLPTADIQFGVGLPFGITLEGGFLPGYALYGTTFSKYEGALKWTLTRSFLSMLPFDVGARFSYTSASLTYGQTLGAGTVNVNYSSAIYGGQLLVSKSLILLEPYLGLGFINHSSTIAGSGTVNLFGSSFPAGTQTFSAGGSSLWLQAGLLLKFGFFGVGFEYDNMYGMSSYSAKSSFRF